MSTRLTTCLVALAFFVVLGAATDSLGSQDKFIEEYSPQEVVDGMATKGVRGTANILTGWLEFPKQIYLTTQEDGWPRGTVIGPLKGIGMAIVRTVSGALELCTFFSPYPGFYKPYLNPPYVWQKE